MNSNELVVAVMTYDTHIWLCTEPEHQTDEGLRFAVRPHPHGLVKRKYCQDAPEYQPTKADHTKRV